MTITLGAVYAKIDDPCWSEGFTVTAFDDDTVTAVWHPTDSHIEVVWRGTVEEFCEQFTLIGDPIGGE